MNPIEMLEQEHEDIERELVELEAIKEAEEINYSNLSHVFRNLIDLWNKHEEKEEKLFPILKKEKIIVPVKKMLFEHKLLRPHREAINVAIDSGSEKEICDALEENGVVIIAKLREHIKDEDEILYTITLAEFSSEELKELWASVN